MNVLDRLTMSTSTLLRSVLHTRQSFFCGCSSCGKHKKKLFVQVNPIFFLCVHVADARKSIMVESAAREAIAALLVLGMMLSATLAFFFFNSHMVPVGKRAVRRVRGTKRWLKVLDEGRHFLWPLFTHIVRGPDGNPVNLPSEAAPDTVQVGPCGGPLGEGRTIEVVADVDFWIDGDPSAFLLSGFDADCPPRAEARKLATAVLTGMQISADIPLTEVYKRVVRNTTKRATLTGDEGGDAAVSRLTFRFREIRVCNIAIDAMNKKALLKFDQDASASSRR